MQRMRVSVARQRPSGLPLIGLWLTLLPLLSCVGPGQVAELADEFPEVDLEKLEPGVRDGYREVRLALEQARASPHEEVGLAGAYGTLGNWLEIHNLDGSERAYRQAIQFHPGDPRWHYHLGRLHHRLGRLDSARPAYDRVLEREFEHVPTLVAQGDLALLAGRLMESREFFLRALAARPSCAAARLGLGRLDLEAGKPGEAVIHLEAALALQPDVGSSQYLLGRAYLELDDARAEDLFMAVENRKSEQRRVRVEDPWLESMLALRQNAAVDIEAGLRAQRKGDLRGALRLFGRAAQGAPSNVRPLLHWAAALRQVGDRAGARSKLDEALRTAPGNATVHLQMGLLLAEEDPEEAISHLEAAVARDPRLAVAHYALAEQRWRAGEVEAALESFSIAVDLDSSLAAARHGRAVVLAALGRLDEARETLTLEGPGGSGSALQQSLLMRLVAFAPDAGWVDRARALDLPSPLAGHTVHSAESQAMALASVGRFEEAQAWQLAAVEAAQGRGRVRCSPEIPRKRLERYMRREPPLPVAWERTERICQRPVVIPGAAP